MVLVKIAQFGILKPLLHFHTVKSQSCRICERDICHSNTLGTKLDQFPDPRNPNTLNPKVSKNPSMPGWAQRAATWHLTVSFPVCQTNIRQKLWGHRDWKKGNNLLPSNPGEITSSPPPNLWLHQTRLTFQQSLKTRCMATLWWIESYTFWREKVSEETKEGRKGGWGGHVLYHLSLKAKEKVRECLIHLVGPCTDKLFVKVCHWLGGNLPHWDGTRERHGRGMRIVI